MIHGCAGEASKAIQEHLYSLVKEEAPERLLLTLSQTSMSVEQAGIVLV